MAESFENLADWENEDLEKSLAEAVDSYDKKEEEKKHVKVPCVCSVIDHRGRQNVVRTSVTHSAAPRVPLFCSYHILTSSVIYY